MTKQPRMAYVGFLALLSISIILMIKLDTALAIITLLLVLLSTFCAELFGEWIAGLPPSQPLEDTDTGAEIRSKIDTIVANRKL
jgi:hypothetical protein